MTHDNVGGFVLSDKPVFDWNQNPVGKVADVGRDPKTQAAESLVVNLGDEDVDAGEVQEEVLTIPIKYVFGIRRDSVTLDRSIEELLRIERPVADAEQPVARTLKH